MPAVIIYFTWKQVYTLTMYVVKIDFFCKFFSAMKLSGLLKKNCFEAGAAEEESSATQKVGGLISQTLCSSGFRQDTAPHFASIGV